MSENVDILVIDDDIDLCQLMQTVLKSSGYSVKGSHNADEVEALVQKRSPRVLVMDMLLSGHDGREICRTLRKEDSSRGLKIMMVSAHPEARETCISAGADDFVGKPFELDDFIRKVASLYEQT